VKKRIKYMHLINGFPAYFGNAGINNCQIFYADGKEVALADSVKQIRREQRISIAFRKRQGWDCPNYSHLKVIV